MKLEKWALISEIISAIAIVLSLIFVGMQVRQGTEQTAANSRALEATVRESMLNADLSILQVSVPYKNMQQFGPPANQEETNQQSLFAYMLERTRENYWKQRNNGMLDEESYLSYRETFLQYLINSDFHLKLWKENEDYFVPGFVAEINVELRKHGRLTESGQETK